MLGAPSREVATVDPPNSKQRIDSQLAVRCKPMPSRRTPRYFSGVLRGICTCFLAIFRQHGYFMCLKYWVGRDKVPLCVSPRKMTTNLCIEVNKMTRKQAPPGREGRLPMLREKMSPNDRSDTSVLVHRRCVATSVLVFSPHKTLNEDF